MSAPRGARNPLPPPHAQGKSPLVTLASAARAPAPADGLDALASAAARAAAATLAWARGALQLARLSWRAAGCVVRAWLAWLGLARYFRRPRPAPLPPY